MPSKLFFAISLICEKNLLGQFKCINQEVGTFGIFEFFQEVNLTGSGLFK